MAPCNIFKSQQGKEQEGWSEGDGDEGKTEQKLPEVNTRVVSRGQNE